MLNSTHRPTDSACHRNILSAASRLNRPSSSLTGSSAGPAPALAFAAVGGGGPDPELVFSCLSAADVEENPPNLRFMNAAVAAAVALLDDAAAAVEEADAAAADNWFTMRSNTDAFALCAFSCTNGEIPV